jgi:hypothetical protein
MSDKQRSWTIISALLFLFWMPNAWIRSMQTANSPQQTLRVEFAKPGDTALISEKEAEGGMRVSLELKSPKGIGQCIVHRNSKAWPKPFALRFDLRGLEQVVIHVGNRKWLGSVSSHDGTVRWTRSHEDALETPIATNEPDWCPIRVAESTTTTPSRVPLAEKERWELTLPAHWLAENPDSIQISWIDFYR